MRRILFSDTALFVVGAVCINLGLYGAGVRFGWWGYVFWAGIGVFFAGLKRNLRQ